MALGPWQEVIGRLRAVSLNGPRIEVQIVTRDGLVRLSFERDSSEGERLPDILLSRPIGSKVGFIRTDSKSSSILIRTVPGQ